MANRLRPIPEDKTRDTNLKKEEAMTREMNPRNEDNRRIWRAASKRARLNVIDDTGTQFSALMREVSEIMAGAAWKARQLGVTLLEAVSGVVRPALRRALAPGGDPLMGAKA